MILLLPLLAANSSVNSYSYIIQEESWVSLSGSSNVNTFECFSNSRNSKGALVITVDGDDNAISFSDALMNLNIKSFDCNNPLLNKDLYKALGAEEAPYISIELIDAKPTRQMKVGPTLAGTISTTIAVTINNKCKMMEVPIDWQRAGTSSFRFTGSKEINMSDFDITPPSPAFGLIKVHNQISINFSIVVEANSVMLAEGESKSQTNW
jgi:hypothetical protein